MANDRPGDPERGERRFWVASDVETWIQTHCTDPDTLKDVGGAAVWWCCYRNTEALVDDTIKHIAQSLMGGVGPFTSLDVIEMVQNWTNELGEVGDWPGIDDAIEQDLRSFFNVEGGG